MTSTAVFVAGASHLISTRAASSMPSTTRSAKLSCFGGAGSSAGEFGGAGGSVNTPWGSLGDLFVMVVVVWCGCECVVLLQEVFCGVLWCLRGCGQPEIPTNVRVCSRCLLRLSEMIPGGLATFLKGRLLQTRLRRRGEASGRVVAEAVAFRRLSRLLVPYSPLSPLP